MIQKKKLAGKQEENDHPKKKKKTHSAPPPSLLHHFRCFSNQGFNFWPGAILLCVTSPVFFLGQQSVTRCFHFTFFPHRLALKKKFFGLGSTTSSYGGEGGGSGLSEEEVRKASGSSK